MNQPNKNPGGNPQDQKPANTSTDANKTPAKDGEAKADEKAAPAAADKAAN